MTLPWTALHQEALTLQRQGRFAEAMQRYQVLLPQQPDQDTIWSDFGLLCYQTGQYQQAVQVLLRSLELNRSQGLHHYRLGLVLEKLEDFAQARKAYQNAIQLDPQLHDAYCKLADLCLAAGAIDQAETIARQALAANPQQATIQHCLGRVLTAALKDDEAVRAYEAAHALDPTNTEFLQDVGVAYETQSAHLQARAYFYLGCAAYVQENYSEAAKQFEQFINCPQNEASPRTRQQVYAYWGTCLQKLDRLQDAIALYQTAVQQYPTSRELQLDLVVLLQSSNLTQQAIAIATQAAEQLPEDWFFQWARRLSLPILYRDLAEIDRYRQRFTQGLSELTQQSLNTPEAIHNALLGVGHQTNFYLQYQGRNDLDLQVQYGQWVHQIMAANYPQWAKPASDFKRNRSGKIRVGYLSNCIWEHTIGKLFAGWLQYHNADQFEVYCYHLGDANDALTAKFRQWSYAFHHLPLQQVLTIDFDRISQQLATDKLDILVFLDIGMHPFITLLAGLRFAPVQCVAWGHPVTSGSPTIDYFLSSELMEPEAAEQHYSETLVQLPNLSIAYTKPELPQLTKSRADFYLQEQSVVYLCCQSLFKYLPQYDYILAEIAQRVPQAQFVFIENVNKLVTQSFEQRILKTFADYGLKGQRYCRIVPRLNQTDYWQLNLLADVFLDTLVWSGGNTTLEAIACNLPVVNCPGEFMRGRHSYAILKMMGITETIAQNEADYIEIAVRLGLNLDWRNELIQKVKANQKNLYNDQACLAGLEAFYQKVARN